MNTELQPTGRIVQPAGLASVMSRIRRFVQDANSSMGDGLRGVASFQSIAMTSRQRSPGAGSVRPVLTQNAAPARQSYRDLQSQRLRNHAQRPDVFRWHLLPQEAQGDIGSPQAFDCPAEPLRPPDIK